MLLFLAPDAVKLEASGDLSFFYKQEEVRTNIHITLNYVLVLLCYRIFFSKINMHHACIYQYH